MKFISRFKSGLGFVIPFISVAQIFAQFPPTPLIASPLLSFESLIVNDNYTGNAKDGKSGRYLGADDFLTVSFLLDGRYNATPLELNLHAITSRKFGYRYDLGQFMTGGFYQWKDVGISWTFGGTWRGDLGLDAVQNGFHSLKGFPEVDLPYLPGRFGMKTALDFSELRSGLFGFDTFSSRMGGELAWRNLPNKIWADFGYRYSSKWVSGETFGGYRYHFNNVSGYSEFLRKGFIYGTAVSLGKPDGWTFETGILFFPASNLKADATYKQKAFFYSPQIWTGVSFQGGLRSATERMSHI